VIFDNAGNNAVGDLGSDVDLARRTKQPDLEALPERTVVGSYV
jgi:hypothetical protein